MSLLAVFYFRTNLTKNPFGIFSQPFLCLALETKMETELLPVYGEDLGLLYLLLLLPAFPCFVQGKK